MTEHTALPKLKMTGGHLVGWYGYVVRTDDENEVPITLSLPKSRAAFIVRACNNIDEVVKVLKECRKAIASLPEGALGEGGDGRYYWPLSQELLKDVNAALAKVEEA